MNLYRQGRVQKHTATSWKDIIVNSQVRHFALSPNFLDREKYNHWALQEEHKNKITVNNAIVHIKKFETQIRKEIERISHDSDKKSLIKKFPKYVANEETMIFISFNC